MTLNLKFQRNSVRCQLAISPQWAFDLYIHPIHYECWLLGFVCSLFSLFAHELNLLRSLLILSFVIVRIVNQLPGEFVMVQDWWIWVYCLRDIQRCLFFGNCCLTQCTYIFTINCEVFTDNGLHFVLYTAWSTACQCFMQNNFWAFFAYRGAQF